VIVGLLFAAIVVLLLGTIAAIVVLGLSGVPNASAFISVIVVAATTTLVSLVGIVVRSGGNAPTPAQTDRDSKMVMTLAELVVEQAEQLRQMREGEAPTHPVPEGKKGHE
jgi:membrane protein implicated in regulation of membrane protease activity